MRIHSLILRIVLILKWKCFLLFYLRIFTRFADLMAFVIRLVVLRFILRLPFYSRAKKNYKTATIDKRIDKMCTQLYTGMNDTNFLSLSFPSFAFAATFQLSRFQRRWIRALSAAFWFFYFFVSFDSIWVCFSNVFAVNGGCEILRF